MTRPVIVQFGAGNIGRSLVGQLFSRAGWEVVFVDAYEPLVTALNEQRSYEVVIKDDLPEGTPDRIAVGNVRAISALDTDAVRDAIAGADLVGTAVGAGVLPRLAPALAAGIAARTEPVNVLLCENLRGAADILGEKLAALLPAGFPLSERVGLVATSIGKMVPIMPEEVRDERPLEVWAEAYNRIVADADGFLGAAPEVPGLLLKHNFDAYVDRKLFIHNFGHAVAAYLGALSGHTYIWECMGSESLRAETEAAMWETGRALIRRYPQEFTEENQGEHIQDLLRRFANKALGDSVFRVGRDLSRKLDPNDRCIGALRLVREEGGDWRLVCRTIAAALCFRATDESGNAFPADIEFLDRLRKEGVSAVLASHCGISAESDAEVHQAIVEYYTRLREC